MRTIVTKREFAILKGRKPSAISNWITAGKITSAALIGEGTRARIWVEQADADLARTLDPSRQAGQAKPIAGANDDDLRRRRRADVDRAELEAEQVRRRMAQDEGRWMLAADAKQEWGRELSQFITDFETFLTRNFARAISERHGLDWKAVATDAREIFRAHRADIADAATAKLRERGEME